MIPKFPQEENKRIKGMIHPHEKNQKHITKIPQEKQHKNQTQMDTL
jgi:hypothetical protein